MARSGVVVADSSACFCQGCALGERDAGGMRFAVRLEHEGRIHGVLAVSCGADVTADEEEQSLLDEVAGDIAFALHNMDLAEDGKRTEEARRIAGRELAIRNRIAEVFLTVSDDEMYGEALPILLDAMESEYGVFGYIGETGALVVPSMTRHIWDKCQVSDKRFVFPRETWGNSTWPVAIREKRVICINEPSTLTPKGHIAITRHISLPLIHRGEVVGLIQVANKATDYSKADVALLETIGGAIAPVLDARLKQERQEAARKQAEEELRKHRDKLEVLVTQRTQELAESRQRLAKETAAVAEIVGEMLSGHLTDAETERQVLNACLGATNSVYGMIGVVNQHGRYDATTYGGRTLSDCAFPEALTWEITTGMEIRGIWGWPMIHGKPLLCNNLQDHPDRVGSPNGHVPIECFLGVPVRREGKVTGMVAVANKPGNYTEADVETLTRLVDVMSVSRQYRGLLTELEQRVHERTAQLEESNKELEAFSYSVSHDLRAPLRAIDGFSQILTEDYSDKLDDEGLRLLRVVQNSAHAMGRLIDDLLNFSRLSRKEMRTSEFDMGELAAEVFEGLRVAVPGRDVRLSVGSLPRAVGDRAMVRQVFVNLLSNAVKFTAPRETALIEVSGGREGNENAYCVKDNGVGFSMDYAGKLFRVFQRLHAAAEFEGTGIGLALVQRIIRRHGGRVWGEGKLNEGAAFYFTLPSKEATNG